MKIAFVYSGLTISLDSTVSVPRVIAEHAARFAASGMEVAIISPQAKPIPNCVHIPLEMISTLQYKIAMLKWKLFKKKYPTRIKPSSFERKVSALDKEWIFVVPKHGDLALIRTCKPLNLLFLWIHHCPEPVELQAIVANRSADGMILPTFSLYQKILDLRMIKGLYLPAFIIRLFLNAAFSISENGLRVNNKKIRIVHLGGNSSKKGLEVVLMAMQLVVTNKEIEFHSFGHSSAFDIELKKGIRYCQRSNVGREELKQELSIADIGLVPSVWFENSPTAMIEMMSSGIPVIASKAGGIPEILGDAGMLIENPNVCDEWSRSIEYLANDESERLRFGKMGHTRVTEIFDDQVTLDGWRKLLSLKKIY